MEDYGHLNTSWAQGFKGVEICYIDKHNVCYICGNTVKFVSVSDGVEQIFHCPGNGVSAIATAPSCGLFAVAEKGFNPEIFICRFPSMEVVQVLKNGAELEYMQLAFSQSGNHFATCSGVPNFNLIVWEVATGLIQCAEKLASDEDVISLQFDPLNQRQLSVIEDNKITLWSIEICNDIAMLKSRNVELPASDGTVLGELSRSGTRLDFHLDLPISTKAGLIGENVSKFQAPEQRHARVNPSSQVWSNKGEIFVGCRAGQLFKVDSETCHVTLLIGSMAGEMKDGMFKCMELNSQGLYAGGSDGILREINVNTNKIRISEIQCLESSITSLTFDPATYSDLVYGTIDGTLHRFNMITNDSMLLSNTRTGKFVGLSYFGGGRYVVTARESGEIQVWEFESGDLVTNLSLMTEVTAVSCCPSCPVIVAGTWDGSLLFVDASSLNTDGPDLRLISSVRMHRGPVTNLLYDNVGQYLLSACSDESKVFVLRSQPSSKFECIGYVECNGLVKDVSITPLPNGDSIIGVVTTPLLQQPSGVEEVVDMVMSKVCVSNQLVVFTLISELIDNPDDHYQSLRHNFKETSVNFLTFDLSVPVESAIVCSSGDKLDVFALSSFNKKLMKFKLLGRKISQSDENSALQEPISEHVGHDLLGGKLIMSSHGSWIASSSSDGSIIVRDINNLDSTVSIIAHSFIDGGTKDILFSPDSSQIVSIGKNDDSIFVAKWEFTSKGRLAHSQAVDYARVLNMKLRSFVEQESEVLSNMEEHIPEKLVATFSTEDSPAENRPTSIGGSDIVMTPTPEPSSDATWLDTRGIIAAKDENQKYDEVKRDLRKNIKDLRKTILDMMKTNETLPDLEKLKHEEFNLDSEEQKRMQATQDKAVQEAREVIKFENLAQQYLAYLIKKECWDNMIVKGRALKNFNHLISVTNYPMMETTNEDKMLLDKVTRMRQIEIEEYQVRLQVVEKSKKEEDEEGGEEETGLSLHGSLGPNYNGDNGLFYSQFDIHTREQKIAQIILIKDAICRIKQAFNDSFDNVYRNKEQEIARISERNVRIRVIMEELGLDTTSLKEFCLDDEEMPEKVFIVADDEVKVERVLSEEQQREEEEEQRREEERKKAAKGDNKRERGLIEMMGGVLEVKKEDMLKQDIPPPDFMVEKLEKDWSDEEKKLVKEHEKKLKELQEEREKYRKNLENELKKLQQSNFDGMAAFDDSLVQLFNRKVKTEMVVNQEESKILRLTNSTLISDDLSLHENHLNSLMKSTQIIKATTAKLEEEIREKVDEYREVYDSTVAEDKILDRGFKREFSDIPLSISDQLYKLFKRRPRLQRQKNSGSEGSNLNPYGDGGTVMAHDFDISAMAELDDEVNMPEGVDSNLWGRLCETRRSKVESEMRVKQSAQILTEMAQYLQNRQNEDEKFNQQIEDLVKQQIKLIDDSMKNSLNVEVQLLLKQGQVEVLSGPFIPDFSDSILVHRGVVEDLNGIIRTLGESKVAAMTESKDFKKGIHLLEWERKRMIMTMEDLHNRARHIQMLKLTKDLQAFLNEENQQAKQSKQIQVLEQTLNLQEEEFNKAIDKRKIKTKELERKIRSKEEENNELDKVLEELHVSVSERKNICDVNAGERAKNTADRRLRGIVQRRKLVDLAKAQAKEVAVLRAEVERLRMKTFPALVQVER